MASKKEENEEKPRVHKDLDGFDIKINSFGEIQMSYDIEKINDFLNKNVEDKKLKDIDLEEQKVKKKKK
ncbi:hypothetical protein LAG90_08235 [Marinilongibacter aquaticus]|uniref:hypothetical protein n=1 Tax=Marinilongibacter aquaticus TaxID=2975157 RepID=UPI0021BD29AE|nr:hypothetical protein [Marinilongibacter aquaticus]UBM60627.1 hypothetical protein LAG90_08235 [Marinilongibacter aquaticus]